MNFEYNKHVVQFLVRNGSEHLQRIHLTCLKWLVDNLQSGRDYNFTGAGAGARNSKSILVVQEYIWFNKEEDLVAFRLATGL